MWLKQCQFSIECWYCFMDLQLFGEDIGRFLQSLDITTRAKTDVLLDALSAHGSKLRMPYSKALGGGLFELRVQSVVQARIFYSFHRNRAILLHAFVKKSMRIAEKELFVARARQRLIDGV